MTFSLDHARFDRDVRRLAELMKQELRPALDGQAKLFVRDCMKATPPFTPGKNWTEGFPAQKAVGDNATHGQVERLFQPLVDLRMYKQVVIGKAGRAGRELRKMAKVGNYAGMTALLRKMGIKTLGVIGAATRQIHKAHRDRRGRTRRGSFLVTAERTIKIVSLVRLRNVGLAKSGWVKAARALKLPVPRWVVRHPGVGIFQRGGTPESPTVTVGNGVPYIQGTGMELRIMEWAMKNRLRNIKKQIENVLRAQARKARAT